MIPETHRGNLRQCPVLRGFAVRIEGISAWPRATGNMGEVLPSTPGLVAEQALKAAVSQMACKTCCFCVVRAVIMAALTPAASKSTNGFATTGLITTTQSLRKKHGLTGLGFTKNGLAQKVGKLVGAWRQETSGRQRDGLRWNRENFG